MKCQYFFFTSIPYPLISVYSVFSVISVVQSFGREVIRSSSFFRGTNRLPPPEIHSPQTCIST
jgi:hypothetical protein